MLSYDGKRLIPAPFFQHETSTARTRGGEPLSQQVQITLHGSLVAEKGSPLSDGTFWTATGYPPDASVLMDGRLGVILTKQEALKNLFSNEEKLLEVQSDDGSTPRKYIVRNARVNFNEGNWVEKCEYTVTLDGIPAGTTEAPIESASETWNIETLDEKLRTYRLTHALQSQARSSYDEAGSLIKHGWENARDYVLTTLGLGLDSSKMVAAGVIDGDTLQAYNYLRSSSLDELEGSFSVTESWVCLDRGSEPPATEEFTVDFRRAENRIATVTVAGTITGLEHRDTSTFELIKTRFENASDKWEDYVEPALFSRAEAYSGVNLNSTALNRQVGFNTKAGTIIYSYEYSNRRAPATPNAITESVTITNDGPVDVFASIAVLGRPAGPVLQGLATYTARKRVVNVEVVMAASTVDEVVFKPDVSAIILAEIPAGTVYLEQNTDSWNPEQGRYTRTVGWTWEI